MLMDEIAPDVLVVEEIPLKVCEITSTVGAFLKVLHELPWLPVKRVLTDEGYNPLFSVILLGDLPYWLDLQLRALVSGNGDMERLPLLAVSDVDPDTIAEGVNRLWIDGNSAGGDSDPEVIDRVAVHSWLC